MGGLASRREATMRRIVVLLGSVLILLSMAAAPAGASATVTVAPSTHLTNGEQVTVTWFGMHAGHRTVGISISECNTAFSADSWNACTFLASAAPSTAGNFQVNVVTGAVGTDGGTCGTSSADRRCLIVVYPVDKEGSPQLGHAVVPVRFAVP
jgi:hypothetical protein